MASDIKSRLTGLSLFKAVESCSATDFEKVAARFVDFSLFPAAIVIIGPAEYPDQAPRAPAQRLRETQVGILIAGIYNAEPDEDADTVWDLEDAVDRNFTPADTAKTPVLVNGVYYSPIRSIPVGGCDGLAVRLLTLKAEDPVQARTSV